MKKTPWYPASIDPVRVGMYMCNRQLSMKGLGDEMLFWDGKEWFYPNRKVWAYMSPQEGDKWRGLTKEAK